MRSPFRSPRFLLLALALCAPTSIRAQGTADTAAQRRLRTGDSVRVWSQPPSNLSGVRAAVVWHRTDSLALSNGAVLPMAGVSRLQVRRLTEGRSAVRVVAGSVVGLAVGAVIGGVIGYGASGGFDGQDKGYGDGMGVIIGVPAGAVLGMVLGGSIGGRKHPRARWVDVWPAP